MTKTTARASPSCSPPPTSGRSGATPHPFEEPDADICDDARAFRKEARRRLGVRAPRASGDRIRVVGSAEARKDCRVAIPEECALDPSSLVATLDGQAVNVEALLLGPDSDVPIDAQRNAASLGMRVTVQGASGSLRALLLGDMGHDELTRVFARDYLTWDVLLAPHHCSTTALCLDSGSGPVDDELMSAIEATRSTCAYIVASAGKIPSSDKDGADPPHARAKRAYERLVQAGHFVCTGEHFAAPRKLAPIAFDANRSGCGYVPLRNTQPARRRPRPGRPAVRAADTLRLTAMSATGEHALAELRSLADGERLRIRRRAEGRTRRHRRGGRLDRDSAPAPSERRMGRTRP